MTIIKYTVLTFLLCSCALTTQRTIVVDGGIGYLPPPPMLIKITNVSNSLDGKLTHIQGIIYDSLSFKNSPNTLSGANINIKGKKAQTYSDYYGTFSFGDFELSDTLLFSLVGFERKFIPIKIIDTTKTLLY
jgi:hypothetical protein